MSLVKVVIVVYALSAYTNISVKTEELEDFKKDVNQKLMDAAYSLLGFRPSVGQQPTHSTLLAVVKLVKEQTKEINKLKKLIGKGEGAANNGAVYVRWGRHDCPANGTETVYKGFASGSWSTHTGGSVNYVCLPEEPVYDKYDDIINNDNQNMQGAEYSIRTVNIKDTALDQSLNGHDVPCVVCRSTARSSLLRIPGRNKCYDGWHLEYAGYLMSGKYTDAAASEYICVDSHPTKLHGGKHAKGGKKVTPVEGHCNYSLRCPPYKHGRELTCAVCTK